MQTVAIVVLITMVLLGIPVWVSVLTGATLLAVVALHMDPTMIISIMVEKVSQSALIAVPLFIFSGDLLARGGSAAPLVKVLNGFMGHIPGGPAYVMVIACAIFGAMSSSATAAIAGFGPLLIPMMIEAGYSKKFAIGLLIISVSLAPLIPPSIPLILFGFITETSIRDLYLAGFPAGLLLAALICVTVYVQTKRGHYSPPIRASWRERRQAIKEGWPVLLMPLIVTVPIYTGVATPSEAAVIASLYSLFLGFAIYKKLSLGSMWQSARRTIHVTAMIFVIVGSAFILNLAFTYIRIPFEVSDAISSAGLNAAGFMIIAILIFFLMGCVLDPSAILMVTAPLLMPTVLSLGISPVVFGVVVVFSIEIAGVTPPYGLHIFAAVGILKEPFGLIARSCLLFYPALIVGQLMLAYIPQISLCLTYLKN
ncbi:TRAP transporter large permease [Chloroflexota bacterium]